MTTNPHVIVPVETTPASMQVIEVTEAIYQGLESEDVLPPEPFLETGQIDGEPLVNRQMTEGTGPVSRSGSGRHAVSRALTTVTLSSVGNGTS